MISIVGSVGSIRLCIRSYVCMYKLDIIRYLKVLVIYIFMVERESSSAQIQQRHLGLIM